MTGGQPPRRKPHQVDFDEYQQSLARRGEVVEDPPENPIKHAFVSGWVAADQRHRNSLREGRLRLSRLEKLARTLFPSATVVKHDALNAAIETLTDQAEASSNSDYSADLREVIDYLRGLKK